MCSTALELCLATHILQNNMPCVLLCIQKLTRQTSGMSAARQVVRAVYDKWQLQLDRWADHRSLFGLMAFIAVFLGVSVRTARGDNRLSGPLHYRICGAASKQHASEHVRCVQLAAEPAAGETMRIQPISSLP